MYNRMQPLEAQNIIASSNSGQAQPKRRRRDPHVPSRVGRCRSLPPPAPGIAIPTDVLVLVGLSRLAPPRDKADTAPGAGTNSVPRAQLLLSTEGLETCRAISTAGLSVH